MYFNSEKDYIVKRKKENLSIEAEKINIKIENDMLYISWGLRNYKIEVSDLINIKKEEREHSLSER